MMGVVLAVLIIGGAIAYGVIGVAVGRRIIGKHVREGHNDVLVPVFLTAGVIYAVLLGFIVVAVWETFDAAHATVAEEAGELIPLYRQSTVMAPEKGAAMRESLRTYAETVAHDEWPVMQKTGKGTSKGRRPIADMFRTFATLTPSDEVRKMIDTQFLQTLSSLSLDRNHRLLEASEQLSWLIWMGVIGGGAVVVGMSFFLYMDKPAPQMVMIGVMSGLIGMMLFMMVVLNKPFSGPLAIDPAPFEQSLATFDEIDKGN